MASLRPGQDGLETPRRQKLLKPPGSPVCYTGPSTRSRSRVDPALEAEVTNTASKALGKRIFDRAPSARAHQIPSTPIERGTKSRPQTAPVSAAKRVRDECKNGVQVIVRVRPTSGAETSAGTLNCIEVQDSREVQISEFASGKDVLRQHRLRSRRFVFDSAFDGRSTQEEVYGKSAKPLVEAVMEGRGNATCFCYGATGAGKTHTMLGTAEQPGVMVLALRDLFRAVQQGADGFQVMLSYLEIYNELVKDLLKPSGTTLELREDPHTGVGVVGLTQVEATSTEEVMALLHKGNRSRTTEPTRANATSSRSHAILQIFITRPQTRAVSKLSLIDLAGSERALATDIRTVRSAEGAHINKSLLALSGCINALVQEALAIAAARHASVLILGSIGTP
ncbi:hypothetical protein CYMTET_13408 [Cymbomonas tetramitiformis]|uniref:Kinesin-like protein n=1 Tax=Cymbomonas tetramitiformis TaxID=36881 RepID=A0AAE0GIJ0_9CHLO|nr:hypothetical protein CYMTET_13408 [Cymbomonas tetramitiformis]